MADDASRFYESLGPMPTRNADGSLSATPIPHTVDQMYEGIYAPPAPVYGQLINNIRATVPINNQTGMPYAPLSAPGAGMTRAQQDAMRALGPQTPWRPGNEVFVPSSGQPFGNGPQAGYVPPGSYRLLPNSGMPSAARDNPAVAAIGAAAKPRYTATYKPTPYLSKTPFPSATPGGLSFRDKFGNAVRTGALLQTVPLPRGVTRQQMVSGGAVSPVAQALAQAMTPPAPPRTAISTNGYVYAMPAGGGTPVRVGTTRPVGMTPAQQYAIAAAPANNPSAGYTPSSSGVSGDYFEWARSGGGDGGYGGSSGGSGGSLV